MTMGGYMDAYRVQRKRTRGWRKPDRAVSVARPSRWGNPYRAGMTLRSKNMTAFIVSEAGLLEHFLDQDIGYQITAAEAVRLYRAWVVKKMADDSPQRLYYNLDLLRGKPLMCWCEPGDPCHADVLVELANG